MLGLLSRFTDLVTLPQGWAWLENGWVMTIVGVLLAVEIVADKIPALDSINDAIQTFGARRPAASCSARAPPRRPPLSPTLPRSRDPGRGFPSRSVSSPRWWCH